ncbi:histidine phosphatase family protein [Actinopolyspora halophila]|uniref:histidine phosphatase family protein n=1 Tax=Actinopolyspora halophila TaxID=1850 RepID=UPI0003760FEC|nr:histidine phosphatase family protein [Actinopolyspora halophila]
MPVTSELLLARHGEAHCNVTGEVGGDTTCTGLTDHGYEQVRQLAQSLRDNQAETPITALYTSPRRRTRNTAAVLGETLSLRPRVDPELRGLDHGDADGQKWITVKNGFGGRPQRYPHRPIAPNAESWNAFLARCHAALRTIIERHAGERIVIAAHGETIEASFSLFYRLPLDEHERAGQIASHACLTRWQQHRNRFGHDVWMLNTHNDTRHLDLSTNSR